MRTSAGTCAASTPKGDARPPIFIPDPRSSKSGLTRTASRGRTPAHSPIANARCASLIDSRLTVAPARIAASSSKSRLPGPAKLTRSGGITASALASSPAEATSIPSISGKIALSSAGSGLALIA